MLASCWSIMNKVARRLRLEVARALMWPVYVVLELVHAVGGTVASDLYSAWVAVPLFRLFYGNVLTGCRGGTP
jgi:hypothetical protein